MSQIKFVSTKGYQYVYEGSRLCTLATAYYYDYDEFYALSEIINTESVGYYAKVRISFLSEYGDVHILLSQTEDLIDNNGCYEFGNYVKQLCKFNMSFKCLYYSSRWMG